MGANLKALSDQWPHPDPRACLNAGLNYGGAFFGFTRPLSYPALLDIVLTKACNLRCQFCISYGSLTGQRWMPFDLYERIARALFRTAWAVSFCSGGEPFLYERIREALLRARDHRTVTTVSSNGMLLTAPVAEWVVADRSLHELIVSFDGSRKETLERIRRGASYDVILENLERLSALKRERGATFPRVRFRYAIMRSNAEEMPAVIQLAARFGLYRVDVVHVDIANDLSDDESLSRHRSLAEGVFVEARRRAREKKIRLDLPVWPGHRPRARTCRYPWRFCQIDTDGSIRFCYHSWRQRVGFFQDDFRTLWHNEPYQKLRRTVNSDDPYYPYCRTCAVRTGACLPQSFDGKDRAKQSVIPGLESLQVPFTERSRENEEAFRERADRPARMTP